jgi:hypothetical protein
MPRHIDGLSGFVWLARQFQLEVRPLQLHGPPIQAGLACGETADRDQDGCRMLQKIIAHGLIINACM